MDDPRCSDRWCSRVRSDCRYCSANELAESRRLHRSDRAPRRGRPPRRRGAPGAPPCRPARWAASTTWVSGWRPRRARCRCGRSSGRVWCCSRATTGSPDSGCRRGPRAAPTAAGAGGARGREPASAILARRLGVPVRVVDMALDCEPGRAARRGRTAPGAARSGRIDVEDALTPEEAEAAFRAGVAVADEEADSGTDLVVLGDLSVGGTTAAAVLVAALCGTDASVVTGRGGRAIDDLAWMRKCAAVRDALRRARPVLGDQLQLLAAVGGADLAADRPGSCCRARCGSTPVILDGVVSAACALVGAAGRLPGAGLVAGRSDQRRAGAGEGAGPDGAGAAARPRASRWARVRGRCSRCRWSRRPPRWRRSCRRGAGRPPRSRQGPRPRPGAGVPDAARVRARRRACMTRGSAAGSRDPRATRPLRRPGDGSAPRHRASNARGAEPCPRPG